MAPGSKESSFHGCYLLVATSARSKGRTYIGYTVNPTRRIKQHNSGSQYGGAKRTSGREWDMVLIVFGFPNNTYALQFEWAWQNPRRSLRLRQDTVVQKLPARGRSLKHCWTIVCHLLNTGPWCRLPLRVRWLHPDYKLDFPDDATPPSHMPLSHGPLDITIANPLDDSISEQRVLEAVQRLKSIDQPVCSVCDESLSSDTLWCQCYHHPCITTYHLTCLATRWSPATGHDGDDSDDDITITSSQLPVMSSQSQARVVPLRQRLCLSQSRTAAGGASVAASSQRHTGASQRRPTASQRQHHHRRQHQPAAAAATQPMQQVLSPSEQLVPIHGACPGCGLLLQWGALVRWRKRLIDTWDKKPPASKKKSRAAAKRAAAPTTAFPD
ncbi:structure-specific endonuclease subunit SLX1 homolog [Sycon ciliatum]|uniref:structure-specific endonuclease subunit SLX1 homolog n=1 Tax=Sycon ciliatum TaxID=27933 RepID=UPI0031F5FADB